MTVILDALAALDRSLGNLEESATAQEQKALRLQQQDLFNSATKGATANGNSHAGIDPALLAKKLDVTIDQIEQLLQEG